MKKLIERLQKIFKSLFYKIFPRSRHRALCKLGEELAAGFAAGIKDAEREEAPETPPERENTKGTPERESALQQVGEAAIKAGRALGAATTAAATAAAAAARVAYREQTAAAYEEGTSTDDFARAFEEFMRAFEKWADELNELKNLVFDILDEYPNKRVKHLAIYATKERTRKKNLNRVIKWALNKRSGYGRCMSPQESPR